MHDPSDRHHDSSIRFAPALGRFGPALFLLVLLAAGGCETSSSGARAHLMFDGTTGQRLSWDDVLARAETAEAIFLGEQHDDAAGHAVQRTLVADSMKRLPGRTALSMEMIETDQQSHVDAFITGAIDRDEFISRSGVDRWTGWREWYQPIVDTAKDSGVPIIAANAPRALVRAARIEGYDHVRSLDQYREGLLVLPVTIEDGRADGYRERFLEVMGVADSESAPVPAPAAGEGAQPPAHGHHITREQGLAFFRSQMVWDATMAQRIHQALERTDVERVIHLVGRFHSDFDGGTVIELRARRPDVRTLIVSLVPTESRSLLVEDRGRADVVIYTR